MHQPSQVMAFALPSPDRLLQRVQHQLDSHRGTRTPAHNCAGIGIGDQCDSDPARPRRHIRDVGHPQPVRRQRHEPATDQVIWPLGSRTSDRGPLHLPTTCPFQPRTAHESFDAAASHRDTFPVELQPDVTGPVDTEVGLVDPTDLDQQLTLGEQLVAPLVVGRWGDLHAMLAQHLADRLDTPPQPIPRTPLGMLTDEVDDHCPGRSTSAAKKAQAPFRIAFTLLNSAFSRFKHLISADPS